MDLSYFSYMINSLNTSKYFSGILMLLLNLGSKYLAMELTEFHEKFLSNVFIRRILVFTVFFMATKDVFVSFILTGVFVILVSGLFNENSKYCVMTKKSKGLFNEITKQDYMKAQKVIQLYELQNMNNNKLINSN